MNYSATSSINDLQLDIMLFVDMWVKTEKTPVPKKTILAKMELAGIQTYTVVNALNMLVKKGFIRRASGLTNKTFYVQLRGI